MPGEWRLRDMQPADVPFVLSIQQSSPHAAQWSVEAYDAAFLEDSRAIGLVVEGWGLLAGFLVFRPVAGELEILNLAVRPEHRRQGIATLLLQRALHLGTGQPRCSRAFLEVRASNTGAVAFYSHHGFREAGLRVGYYTNPVENALVLARALP